MSNLMRLQLFRVFSPTVAIPGRRWRTHPRLAAMAPALWLAACSSDGYSPFRLYDKSIAGPVPVVRPSSSKSAIGDLPSGFSPISPEELDAMIVAVQPPTTAGAGTAAGQTDPEPVTLVSHIAGFGNGVYSVDTLDRANEQMRLRNARNEIVNHLVAVSNNVCGEYEESLKAKSSNVSFALGSLATAFGGAGAIFTNGTSAIFSGLAGITSGVNAEYKQDFFQSLATSIIIPGIEKQRSALYQEMVQRMCFGVTTYPLSMAIADTIRYHNSCTMDKGIAATSQSVGQSNVNAGVAQMQVTIALLKSKGGTGSTPGVLNGQPDASTSSTTPTANSTVSGSTNTPPSLGSAVTLQDCGALDPNGAQIPSASAAATPPKPSVPPKPTPVDAATAANTARVQLALNAAGSPGVVVDGAAGTITSNALSEFQKAHGLPQSGMADKATMAALGITVPNPMPQAAASDPASIKEVQGLLLKQTFGVPISPALRTSGVLDAATVAALVVYQDAQKLPLTGVIDSATFNKLKSVS